MSCCVVYANCQGKGLVETLKLSRKFRETFETTYISNWNIQTFPFEALKNCELFIYQPVAERPGIPSSSTILERLPTPCRVLSMPYMYMKGLWPFHTRSSCADTGSAFPKERHYYADTILDDLAASPLPVENVKKIYMNLDFDRKYDAKAAMAESLEIQKKKERHLDIKTYGYVKNRFRFEKLFYTVRHPTPKLYLIAANQVLNALGIATLSEEALKGIGPIYKVQYHHPIHPALAKLFGLDYVTQNSRYNLWGELFTYEEYIEDYVIHRRMHGALKSGANAQSDIGLTS